MAFRNSVSRLLRQNTSENVPVTSKLGSLRLMSNTIFVKGLSNGTDEESLMNAFAHLGEVVDARVMLDENTGSSKGCGFVNFRYESAAKAALSEMNGKNLNGSKIQVKTAREDNAPPKTHWVFKKIMYHIRNNKPDLCSFTQNLLEENKKDLPNDVQTLQYAFVEMFRTIATKKLSNVKLGMDLLKFMKEELLLCPWRSCLDYLLQACVNAKDKESALMVWNEYKIADLQYTCLTRMRMHQALVAAGDLKSAEEIVSAIPDYNDEGDRHIKDVIKESRRKLAPKTPKT